MFAGRRFLMSFTRIHIQFWLTICLALCVPYSANGQQRMGIAAGVIELAENGARSVPTYCLDYSRRTPMPSDRYSQVLSNESQTIVTVGTERMPLQRAIDRRLISVEGQHISAADFLRVITDPQVQARTKMPEELRRQAIVLAKIYETGGPKIRAQMEAQLAPMLQDMGDHTHLRFINRTSQKMKVEVLQNSALGTRPDDRTEDLLLGGFGAARNSAQQRAIQHQSWIMGLQKKLFDLGYYDGAVDGISGTNTQRAMKAFEEGHGLPRLDDHDVDGALDVVLEHKRIEKANPTTLMATLIHHPNKPQRYTLSTTSGGKAISTNSIAEITANLNEHVVGASASNVYVEFEGFSPNEADAMAFNLRNGERALNAGVEVEGVYREANGDLESLLFRRNLTLKKGTVEIEEVPRGLHRGWFRSTIEFTTRIANKTKNISLTLYAKTRALAEEWTRTVMALLGRTPDGSASAEVVLDPSMSIADIVQQASRKFRNQHPEITDRDFGAEIRDMTGAVQVVQFMRRCIAA